MPELDTFTTLVSSNMWIFITLLLVLFLAGIAGIFVWLWYKGKIPLFYQYPTKFILRERKGGYLIPRRWGKARLYTEKDGQKYYALKVGMLREIKPVPAPALANLYPNDVLEIVQEGRNEYTAVVIKDDKSADDQKNYKVESESSERWKNAFSNMERGRLERWEQDKLWLQLMPYAMIFVAMVGCFLIMAVMAEPLMTIPALSASAMGEYRAASEANLKIARIMNAGKNGTVPVSEPGETPSDVG